MTRQMIDVTHSGLPGAINAIRQMPNGSLVALYDTGSPDIRSIASDIAELPTVDHVVMIDQGFTGSPNLSANVRDCENGAWSLSKAVNKAGWNVPRPTLYLGFPDTAQQAHDLGWRGDVWLVAPSRTAPVSPPQVPAGLNVVAVQWGFEGGYDRSVVFDDTWPTGKTPPPPHVATVAVQLTMPVLGNGATGAAVRTLQGALVARGHALAVDGSFGPATLAAVRAFQGEAHVSVDGIVGRDTWTKIFSA